MPTIELNPALGNGIAYNPVEVFLIAATVFVVVIGLLFLLRAYFHRTSHVSKKYKKVILLVSLPKYSKKQEQKSDERHEALQQKIAVAEVLYSSLAGLKPKKGASVWLRGRHDSFSFEIVARDGKIYFYAAVPEYLRQHLEQQIHAQYPHAYIEEAGDYNIFSSQGVIQAKTLIFKRIPSFPIKTYKKLESDPLNAVTNAMSKVSAEDGAAVQIVVQPVSSGWRKKGVKIASLMSQGKKLQQAQREAEGGFFAWFGKSVPKAKKDNVGEKKVHQLSQMEQEMAKSLEDKASKGGLAVNIRILASSNDAMTAERYLNDLNTAFSQYSLYQYGNEFKAIQPNLKKAIKNFIYRDFVEKHAMILNVEELASIYHFPLPTTETPNIYWLKSKNSAAPQNLPEEGLILGENIYRGIKRVVRIGEKDRRRHMYIIGQTGTGKSYFMSNCFIQDIANGKGVCIIDPHGDLVDEALEYIPKERADDVIVFDPADFDRPLALNMLEFDKPEQKTFVVNEIINIFDKLYDLKATGGPIFEQYMRNSLLLIMDDPESGSTLMEVPKVLADEEFRKMKLSKTKNPVIKDFWEKEALKAGGEAALQNIVPYITSKLTQFVANDYMRPIIGQQKSALNFRKAMDEGKILLVKLSKGKIGDLNANLLGMIIIGKILMAALGRVDTPEKDRKDFYLYIDEFQNFLTEGISIILSEARKYKLNLTIAHQFIGQLVKENDTRIRDAIFGNVGTTICFRVGIDDAELMAKRFEPIFDDYDVINIPNANAYTNLLINGANPPAFNLFVPAKSFDQPKLGQTIREFSRMKYGRSREEVEQEIRERGLLS